MSNRDENLLSVLKYLKREFDIGCEYKDISDEAIENYFRRFLNIFLDLQNK